MSSAQTKISFKYLDLTITWKEIYILTFSVSFETKIKEFQYKRLNNILFANDKLFRFNMTGSPHYAYCKTDVEFSEHLFYHCKIGF